MHIIANSLLLPSFVSRSLRSSLPTLKFALKRSRKFNMSSSESDYTESDLSDSESDSEVDSGSDSGSGSDSEYEMYCAGGSCSRKPVCKDGKCSRPSKSSCKDGKCSRPSKISCKDGKCPRMPSKALCEVDKFTRMPQKAHLPFDPNAIENIILSLIDKFDIKVVMNNEKMRKAALVTTGLSLAGGMIGKHYGGKIGMAIGGAVGGACGLGIVVVSMRDIWEDVKYKLSELFDIVYDYLAGLELRDYKQAAKYLTSGGKGVELATLLLGAVSDLLGKKVMSSITS